MNYQHAAQHLLKQRELGYSISITLKASLRKYALLVLLIVMLVALCLLTPALRMVWLFCIGILFGAMLRDIAWLRMIKKSWPFTEAVTDWTKVEQLAAGEITVIFSRP